jgi:hypothetical protein
MRTVLLGEYRSFPRTPNYHATGHGGKNHMEDPGVDGRIILRWIFRKWGVGVRIGSSWLRIGTGGGNL